MTILIDMEIKVKLNSKEYRYHIFQMINLFYDFADINFVEDESWNFNIELLQNEVIIDDKNDICKMQFESGLSERENIKKAAFLYFTNKTGKTLPWGTLVGIRPSKITLKFIKDGKSRDEIIKYFDKHFCCNKSKAELCIDVANSEKNLVNSNSRNISVYVGMPFCPTKCLYCSFASNPIKGCKDLVEPYLKSLTYEIEKMSEYIKQHELNIECIYFGGGTPTSIDNEKFEKLMHQIYNSFVRDYKIKEFDVECGRPDSITSNKLETMKRYGVNRMSINPQTMNDSTLKFIGRNHSVNEVREKFHMARKYGFDNINMDLIVGLPGEGIEEVNKTCDEIEKLGPDNLTVHGMSVKRASRLYENIVNNISYSIAGHEELNLMYERTALLAKSMKMKPYYMYRQKNMVGNMENIGYTSGKHRGLYNVEMIEERQTIIACGADAVTKVMFLDENRFERQANIKDVGEYVRRIDEMVKKKIDLLNTLY
ncbi:Oxygen-independent coproporphyrinogen-III oxidase 2 [Clostridium ljungdahlii]|uniref:Oxygen-independent coproporphyrinogen-III oxidase 2 n=2 Tax=Clostridium ljungdahlii TaxID=1538 RepID=A0A166S9E5_9CLOT|nr:Oxygen-independent coproporphyrinogen-III oxidase 2 [Clostridium ljungdahlii]